MKYRVRLAEYREIDVEADSKREAEEIVSVMEDEEIIDKSFNVSGMEIWDTWAL